MIVIFVHGWSVTNTDTYGELPAALAAGPDISVGHLFLGKYVSFADEVTVDDIARGMDHAIKAEVIPKLAAGERFACITHSTGGPVVRKWIDLFYRGELDTCPLGHLVMLAPANHGSALAQLGKGTLSRMKFFADDVQPGTGVLDWLELGSDQAWELNREWLTYDCVAGGLYPFVLTGQKIDRSFYDNLNSYTGEPGSDGVVRVAAANMNYGLIRLTQNEGDLVLGKDDRALKTAFGVLPGLSHSGGEMGIMRSVTEENAASHPTVKWVLECLGVSSAAAYADVFKKLEELTVRTQEDERKERAKGPFLFKRTFTTNRYCMLVFRICDDRDTLLWDYDVVFTAGPDYNPNHLPPGFFVDRQLNKLNRGKLTYYIDYDVMCGWMEKPELEGKFGVQIIARPDTGYARYKMAEHKGTFAALHHYFEPNRTLMVDVLLRRRVGDDVFRLTRNLEPEEFTRRDETGELP